MNEPVADVLRYAADMLHDRDRGHRQDLMERYGQGGAVFVLCFEASRRLYGQAAVSAMERHLKASDLRHVLQNADELEVELRTCADALGPDTVAPQVAGLLAELEQVRTRLAAALLCTDVTYDLDGCLQSVEGHYRTADIEAQREAWQPGQEWPMPRPVRARRPARAVEDVPLPDFPEVRAAAGGAR